MQNMITRIKTKEENFFKTYLKSSSYSSFVCCQHLMLKNDVFFYRDCSTMAYEKVCKNNKAL